ncbi:MAG: GAF domain-containing protein [Candidatus Promineifilaceae bacterium]
MTQYSEVGGGQLRASREALRTWFKPRKQSLIAALVILAVLLVLWWQVGRWYEERLLMEQRAEAVSEVSARGSALSSAVNRRLARLQGLHAFVQTECAEADFAAKFDRFAADLYSGSRGIRSLAVAPGNEVRYVYPLVGNEAVLGYQPLADPRPEVVADVERAIDTGQVIISGPIELVQGGLGLIARQAVYQDDSYWGLVNIVLEIPALLTETGLMGDGGQFDYALRDSRGRVFHGSANVFSSSPIITQIVLPEGYWELGGVPRAGWQALIWQPLLIAWIGSLITITLFTSLIYLVINRQRQLALAVAERTQELSLLNAQLEQRVEERTLELTMLLNISRSVASSLDLEVVFDQVLQKLLLVLDYTGGAILTLENGSFVMRAYRGPYSPESTLGQSYSLDNIIGDQLKEQHKPVLIGDVSDQSPRSLVFREATGLGPDGNRHIKSFMGIPLVAREQMIGVLALHHHKANAYIDSDAELAMAFANHVAVAIDNARLYEKAQRLAVLQERQRLARELHDSVSQALYGIALGTRTARALVGRTPLSNQLKEQFNEPLDYVLSLSEGGLAEMRALIFDLRPESLENEGLVAALAKQAAVLQSRHHIQVSAHFAAEEPDAPMPVKEALYRVTQETLNNVVKHARATKITLSLSSEDDQLVLEISDNGRGFDVNGSFAGHLGLRSMRERVEQVGGSLTITSTSRHGTQIIATAPLT